MELALHMGMPVETLTRSMTELELHQWAQFAARKSMPLRRIEIYLAQIAHLVAVTMGGSKAKLEDFMLKVPEDKPDNVIRMEDVRKAFGFNPRKKKV